MQSYAHYGVFIQQLGTIMVLYKWGYDITIKHRDLFFYMIYPSIRREFQITLQYVATSRRDVTRINLKVRGSPQ